MRLYDEFQEFAGVYVSTHVRPFGPQRCGQALANALGKWWPELSAEVAGTEVDPFYRNSRIGAFWTWLEVRMGELETLSTRSML